MKRRTFLKSTPVAAAAAVATISTQALASPAKTLAPPPEPQDELPLAPPPAKFKAPGAPPSKVILTPFALQQGGVGVFATPSYIHVSPRGGALGFGPNKQALTLLYPTPAGSMRDSKLQVALKGAMRSTMRVEIRARAASKKGAGKVLGRSSSKARPRGGTLTFDVPTKLLNAGDSLEIKIFSAAESWVMHRCAITRTGAGPRKLSRKR